MFIDFPDISPVALTLGSFQLRWYALAYLLGILSAWFLTKRNIAKYELGITSPQLDDLVFYTTLGIILGGRLGYVLLYGKAYFWHHPTEILAVWHGGMSFHGGIAGVIAALYCFARKYRFPYLKITDIVALYVPIGIFLGRLANFINDELWGRVATVPWAVKFPSGGYMPRHPSQIYEALSEGVLMFIILNFLWKKEFVRDHHGIISALFLIIYTLSRLCMECFREPDEQIGFIFEKLTLGQLLSVPFLLVGGYILLKSIKCKH